MTLLSHYPISAGGPRATKPAGWQWHRLLDVARLESGHTPSRSRADWWHDGNIPWLALPDIRALDGKIALDTEEHTNEHGIANSSARILPLGTVCLSRTASVGFVTILGKPMATSQDFANWICGPELIPDFLLHALRASRRYLLSLASGAVHKTIYMPELRSLFVCAPEPDEQRLIVGQVKERLIAANALRLNIETQRGEFTNLKQTLIDELYESDDTRCAIGTVANVQSGFAFKSTDFSDTGIRLLRNVNIQPGKLDWASTAWLPPTLADGLNTYQLEPGDILLSLDRPIISTGIKIARVSAEILPALLVQRVGRFRLLNGHVLPDYLYGFLHTSAFRREISGHDRSLGVPHISPGQVESVNMPLPPVEKQLAVIGKLSAVQEATSMAASSLAKAASEAAVLPERFLSEAFATA